MATDFPQAAPAPFPAAPRMSNWRHVALGAYWLGQYFVVTPVYTVLLQVQVTRLIARPSQATAIGVATGLGGVLAMVLPPIVGAWSDRLQTRWGRRRPVMAAATVALALALIVMMTAGGYPQLLVGFVLVVAFVNIAGAAYVALIPDLVHGGETGRASGMLGLFVQLGSVTSLLITLYFATQGRILLTYWAIVVAVLLSLLPSLWAAAGEASKPVPKAEPRGVREFLAPLWTGDFGWAFGVRFLSVAGLYTTLPFLLLSFRDLFEIPNPATFTPLFELVVTVSAIPFAIVCGYLSDRAGRKRFVYLAGVLGAAVLLVFLLGHLLPAGLILALGVLFGIGYGAFTSVDWALGIDTLPDRNRPAKDLGLYHVADSLPRVLLPFFVGLLLDAVNRVSPTAGYRTILVVAAAFYVASAVAVSRIRTVR